MASFVKENIVDIELQNGNIHRSFLNHSIGRTDDDADYFGVRVFRNGEPVNLEGHSVQGYFRDPQGNNIAITSGNSISGNVAKVLLPQACYNYDGQFTLAIKLVGGGATGTMRIVDGVVDNTNTGGAVAPVGSVPTYQEVLAVYDQMVAAKSGSVRFDITQELTSAQQSKARTNVDVPSVADLEYEATVRGTGDNAVLAQTAPKFNEASVYSAGQLVIHPTMKALYKLPDGHAANVTWANTTKVEVTVASELDLKVNISDIENDLTGTTAGKVLDARQGKVLDDKVSDLNSTLKSAIDNVEDEVFILCDSITKEIPINWKDAADETYTTGWSKGYYNATTGAVATSTFYLKSVSSHYFSEGGATLLEITAPDGFFIAAYEYKDDASSTFVKKYGAQNSQDANRTNHLFIHFEEGHKFRFAMGRFSGATDQENHLVDSFIETCVAKFYVTDTKNIEKQIADISTNLDAIFYTNDISFEASDWRRGYYGKDDGAYNTSEMYMCTASAVVISESNATRLTAKAPDGYYIAAYEYASGGTFITRHGSAASTTELDIPFTEGHYFRLTVGRFVAPDTATSHLTDAFVSQIKVSIDEIKLPEMTTKKNKTGDFEWFTVTVDRPLAFGGEEVIDSTKEEEIECVLRLPDSYSKTGTPTRLVLACHGASGYINSSTSTWYNSYWKAFMDDLLAAGYAVFDANVLPTSAGTSVMGAAFGSPLYVNILKAAYDYIVYNYNVYEKIFAHGTSMGGCGATAFTNAYPGLVLAESSFAGRDIAQYIHHVKDVIDGGTLIDDPDDFALVFGYADFSALVADKWSHIEGNAPSTYLRKFNNGATVLPPDRESTFSDWLTYFYNIYEMSMDAAISDCIAFRNVPYKTWDSWGDNVKRTKAKLMLQKAFRTGGNAPFEAVVYESATHTELSYGQVSGMRDQLIAWYKRWE